MREESSVPLPVTEGAETRPGQRQAAADHRRAHHRPVPGRGNRASAAATPAASTATRAKADKSIPGFDYQDYKLGPGDIINVIVWDHPEITIPAGSYRSAEQSGTLVAEDGTIFFPFAGVVKVAGLTTREVRKLLAKRMANVIENVQLDVRIVSFRSKRVYVVGEVAQPGLQPIDDIRMTLVEAVNRAGGITEEADHGNVLLTRNGQTWRVDLQALYEEGDVSQNVLLQPGDIINVPDRELNKVFVLGEVRNPGSFMMNKRRTTLAEALSDAGFVEPDHVRPGVGVCDAQRQRHAPSSSTSTPARPTRCCWPSASRCCRGTWCMWMWRRSRAGTAWSATSCRPRRCSTSRARPGSRCSAHGNKRAVVARSFAPRGAPT